MLSRLITKLLDGYQPKGEPSLDWLPVYRPKKHVQRVKRFHISLGYRRELVISLRRFSTNPARRSKRLRQLVFGVYFLSFREATIVVQRRRTTPADSRRPRLARLLSPSTALVIIGFIGGLYFGAHLQVHAKLYLSKNGSVSQGTSDQVAALPPPKTMPKSLPVHLRIPKIEVDTGLVPVGLDPSGSISMPDSFVEAGWYDQGPTPGELGPAVIVGHVDSTQGIAIFWRLRELLPGDTIAVDRQDGTTAVFKVLEIQQFPQASFPTESIYGDIKYAGLRLITCGGTFSTATHHYDQNTVVYGALE